MSGEKSAEEILEILEITQISFKSYFIQEWSKQYATKLIQTDVLFISTTDTEFSLHISATYPGTKVYNAALNEEAITELGASNFGAIVCLDCPQLEPADAQERFMDRICDIMVEGGIFFTGK